MSSCTNDSCQLNQKSSPILMCVWTHLLRASCSFCSTNHSCPILPTKPCDFLSLWPWCPVGPADRRCQRHVGVLMSWHNRSGGGVIVDMCDVIFSSVPHEKSAAERSGIFCRRYVFHLDYFPFTESYKGLRFHVLALMLRSVWMCSSGETLLPWI